MDKHALLYELAKRLLAEGGPERTAEVLLGRALEATGASRGFLVVRDGRGSYGRAFDVRFGRDGLSESERRFSRSIVRRAIHEKQILYSADLASDARFAAADSARELGSRSVLVAPLACGGEVWGAVYLERPAGLDSFGPEARRLLEELAELAGLSLRLAAERQAETERRRSLERDLFARHRFEGIVTRCPAMLELLETVAQVADTDAPVLVLGETGTGKELIARALHANSSRRPKPFVALHCTALPGQLLESELFGHARGAFTGADRERPGRIASAEGGTLFLDEVAEIPLEAQAKLLRFLQSGEIQRLGSDRVATVDVRVVAATHRELPALVKDGRFRQDLYFRLKVLELRLPPLRERRGDVALLVEHFVRRHARHGPRSRFTPAALAAVEAHDYPGNVRELEHLVERACLLARGPEMDVELLPPELRGPPGFGANGGGLELTPAGLKAARAAGADAAERRFLDALLGRAGGNVSRAARESGLQRTYLHRLLARHRPAAPG